MIFFWSELGNANTQLADIAPRDGDPDEPLNRSYHHA